MNPAEQIAKIDVAPHQLDNGTWVVRLSVSSANGMVETGLLLNPEHAKAIGNALAVIAKTCETKIVIPRETLPA